jgi:hypothetical protein
MLAQTRTWSAAASLAAIVLTYSQSFAGLVAQYEAGTGANASVVQVDFTNGNAYQITLRWDTPMNGFDALQLSTSAISGAALTYDTFSFGNFVTGIGLGTDYQYGNGDLWPIENYWHYWTKVDGAWEMAMFGASDRILTNGSADAWVFGSGDAPQSVPAPGLALFALTMLHRRGRR